MSIPLTNTSKVLRIKYNKFIFIIALILGLGSYQNCSKFSAIPTGQVYAGSSYCLANSTDSACAAQVPICTFNGTPVAEGASVTAFLSSTVCTQQTRTCSNGALSGSYSYASCSTSAPASCLFNGKTLADGSSVTAYLTSIAANCSAAAQSQLRVCSNGALSGAFTYATCVTQATAASCLFNGVTVAHGASVVAYSSPSVAYGSQCQPSVRVCLNGALTGVGDYGSCAIAAPASCLFDGATIASGASVVAYATSTAAYGSSCQTESRICTNGTLSGSNTFASCSVNAPASCLVNGQTIPSGGSIVLYTSATALQNPGCQAESRTCVNGTLSGSAAFGSCTAIIQTTFPSFSLNAGQSLLSGNLSLTYQTDGNLVLYQGAAPLWNSLTAGLSCSANCVATLQTDGNLVLYMNGAPYWSTGTSGYAGAQLTFANAPPYMTLSSASGSYLWSAMTFWDYILGNATISRCIPDAAIANPLCQSIKVMDQNKSALYYRNDGLIQVYDFEPNVGLIGVVKDGNISGQGGAPWLRCLSDVAGSCQNTQVFALGTPRLLQPPVLSASQFNTNLSTAAGLTTSTFKTFYVNYLNPYTCETQPTAGATRTSSKSFILDRVDFGGDLGVQTNVLVIESVGAYPPSATDPWKGVTLERYWYIGQAGVVREESYHDSECELRLACETTGTADCSAHFCTGTFTTGLPGTSTWNKTITPSVSDIVEYCKNPSGGQAPIGYFDNANPGGLLQGWALDPDTPAASIAVHVYADGAWGSGTFIMAASASSARADINSSTGYPGNHAFNFMVPAQWAGHALYIYAVDTGGGRSTLLSGSGKKF